MLKRLYVHNYKCLVNFEINFDQDISLFLGANGSGKSTVFEVLSKLRRVIVDEEKVENVFDYTDRPRWLNNVENNARFELDIEIENSTYKYLLVIKFDYLIEIIIDEESLHCNDKMLFESKEQKTIFADNSDFPLDNSRSILYRIRSYTFILLHYIQTLFLVRINPYKMLSTIKKTNTDIRMDFSNFSEWFSYLNEKNRKGVSLLEKEMRDIFSGFDYFKIEQAGQAKLLQVDFESQANKKEIISYNFHELSEGQKALIALYTLIYCTPDNSIICIDEPENFLALPEIQPWFDALYDQCAERNLQVLLISHHPKIINLLASDSGYWFSRENNLTRIQKISPEDESGLSIAELIERGWIYEH